MPVIVKAQIQHECQPAKENMRTRFGGGDDQEKDEAIDAMDADEQSRGREILET